jgi:hypothetical protein
MDQHCRVYAFKGTSFKEADVSLHTALQTPIGGHHMAKAIK